MKRRTFLAASTALISSGALPAPSVAAVSVYKFKDFQNWLASLAVKQVDGSPTAVCINTGQTYVTFSFNALVRPGEENAGESSVTVKMRQAIAQAITAWPSDRTVTIYWRERPSMEVADRSIILEYCDDGPDVDPITLQRCVMDHNWRTVQAYCRLTVDAKKEG